MPNDNNQMTNLCQQSFTPLTCMHENVFRKYTCISFFFQSTFVLDINNIRTLFLISDLGQALEWSWPEPDTTSWSQGPRSKIEFDILYTVSISYVLLLVCMKQFLVLCSYTHNDLFPNYMREKEGEDERVRVRERKKRETEKDRKVKREEGREQIANQTCKKSDCYFAITIHPILVY